MVEDFLESGLVIAKEIGDSTGGRKPLLYAVNDAAFYAVGVKISRKRFEMILMNLNGTIIDAIVLPMTEDFTPDTVALKIREVTANFETRGEIAGKLLGIGIAAIGPLDRKSGIILKPHDFPVNGWVNVPLVELVKKTIGLPVFLDNKARAGVLGERWYGIAKNLINPIIIGVAREGHMIVIDTGCTSSLPPAVNLRLPKRYGESGARGILKRRTN